jgi:hypothetical protein
VCTKINPTGNDQELINNNALIPRRSPLRVDQQALLGLTMPWDAAALAAPLLSQRDLLHLSIRSRCLQVLLGLTSRHGQFS